MQNWKAVSFTVAGLIISAAVFCLVGAHFGLDGRSCSAGIMVKTL